MDLPETRPYERQDPPPPVVHAVGFSRWKRSALRAVFCGSRVVFVDDASRVPAQGTCAAWGRSDIRGRVPAGVKVVRLEDGFLRSVGLGADLVPPMSLVVDRQGIYYDATRPSDLEELLSSADFTPVLRERARVLRERLVAARLTKYNVGKSTWARASSRKRVILVPGQVESDASLHFGAPGIRTNLALLQAVRQENPGACIIYKPHPDVCARLRARSAADARAREWCDIELQNESMGQLLEEVDEVHVMTSLAGFEALLRGRRVRCYGQPFYAGWGLTSDVCPIARRTRRLTLDELVAGALILYPLYISRISGAIIPVEQALDELIDWRRRAGNALPLWRSAFRLVLRQVVGIR
jgi:capsular polysaccharide export protein